MKQLTLCLALLGILSSAHADDMSTPDRSMLLAQSSFDPGSNSAGVGITQAPGNKVNVTLQKAHHWNINAGPAMSVGLGAKNFMYSANGAYVWDFHPRASARFGAEVALGSQTDAAREFAAVAGTNLYLFERLEQRGRPYATADLGVASARNNQDQINTGLRLGGGVGYEFPPSERVRLNALIHGSVMTTTVGSGNPTVLSARLGVDL